MTEQTQAPAVEQVAETVMVPKNSDTVANALAAFYKHVEANSKAGLTGVALITADVSAAITDLAGAIGAVSGVGADVSADKLGVAEAFMIAGLKVARGQ